MRLSTGRRHETAHLGSSTRTSPEAASINLGLSTAVVRPRGPAAGMPSDALDGIPLV